MKIGVIGATGKAGRLIVKEALDRGHDVTAIVRNAAKVADENVQVLEKDILALTTADLKPFDAVVNAFGADAGAEDLNVKAGLHLIEILKQAPETRLLVIGGAGSLFVDEAKAVRLIETAEFPEEYKPTASQQAQNLLDLQASEGMKWTFISPAIFFDPAGKRTGSYKEGLDNIIMNSKGESYLSYADFAIAAIDEIENGKHVNERFTLVSEQE